MRGNSGRLADYKFVVRGRDKASESIDYSGIIRMVKNEADEIFIGPVGPIQVASDDDPRLMARHAASRIAQTAIECDDLIALVLSQSDPLVRMEAVPRLKARFPLEPRAHDALIKALGDSQESVRCEAIHAISDLAIPTAGDLLASALNDAEPDVRFFAAIGRSGSETFVHLMTLKVLPMVERRALLSFSPLS